MPLFEVGFALCGHPFLNAKRVRLDPATFRARVLTILRGEYAKRGNKYAYSIPIKSVCDYINLQFIS